MTALDADKNNAAAQATLDEPYGQQGMLGWMCTQLAKISLVAALFSLFLWYWSNQVGYLVEVNRPESRIRITSIAGRMVFRYIPEPTTAVRPSMNPPIEIPVPAFTAANPDPWQPSLWKSIGIEQVAEVQPNGIVGSVLRIRWHLIVICLLIAPALLLASRLARRWRRDDDHDEFDDDETPARV